ncbi:MarR family winged helix-turn-helix transcriptional regulator [Lactobacillus pasteurii]|uniref:L-fucose operon n=1 Tax=Lactobacillus pasteurii DSM 23907 = CRBIP 24.76 TaxID=1423790 RepID=I7LBG5_9LACO|nr:MarR family transcriptional regulator [Lactobacillus pasteurii]TDG75755.1 hypothetical protein C5L33_000640 [Lactobacillus pasteurii]CCI85561.1 L-fucose operon [Lactobacillus pasteurii DSM 23907 = CRBIP 24.76]
MDVLSFSAISEYIKKEINHKCGLNLSQTRLLLFFYHSNNQPLAMGELANELHISLSTLSRQLQQKKTQEYISITRLLNDSSKNVNLNSAGLKKAQELEQELSEIEQGLLAQLDEDHTKIFASELEKLSKYTE